MKRIGALLVLCATLPFAASATAAGPSAADLAKATALTDAFVKAVNANDSEAAAALYADDALLMPPNGPVTQGRTAIQAFFERFPKITDLQCKNIVVHGSGDLVYVAGMYSMTIHPDGAEPFEDDGKYLDIRRKDEDGTWRFAADMFNTSLPAK